MGFGRVVWESVRVRWPVVGFLFMARRLLEFWPAAISQFPFGVTVKWRGIWMGRIRVCFSVGGLVRSVGTVRWEMEFLVSMVMSRFPV